MSAPLTNDSVVDDLPPASPDDKDLALAFQRGEKGAYQGIYERYEERVQRVCRRMLGKREDAQEASQETFLRVYTALGKFNGRYQLGPWITRIATNVCLDQIRARSRRPVEAVPIEEMELELASGGDSDPETMTVRAVESRRVRKILLELPPLHRAAIVLRDFEGLSYAEVGVALGMTDCQVKALIHRARKGFRKSWRPLAEMLVPARLLHRFRETDVSLKEQVVQATASQSAPLASVCSGLLQQCGSFIVDKVVPVGVSVVLGGGAALAAVPEAVHEAVQDAPAPPAAVAAAAPTHDPAGEERSPRVATASAPAAPAEPSAAPSAPPESAPPEATPSPTPTPTASEPPASASPPPAGGSATNSKTTTPTSSFPATVYFEQGQSPTSREPAQHATSFDCSTRSIEQTMKTVVSDREGSYPIDVKIRGGASYFQIEFTVYKHERAVYYSGGGSLVAHSSEGSELDLAFNGRFGASESAASAAGLPANGSIRADFSLDCGAQSVIAESVVFTTQ